MTWTEALDWSEYIGAHGSINTARNLERGFALIASLISRATGGKATMQDFMPHAPKEDEQELSLEEAFERWK